MKNKFLNALKLVGRILLAILLAHLLVGSIVLISIAGYTDCGKKFRYEQRESGDFVVRFHGDYCEIYGTTEQGNSKRFLVIPEYIEGVRVDSLGYRSLAGGLNPVLMA